VLGRTGLAAAATTAVLAAATPPPWFSNAWQKLVVEPQPAAVFHAGTLGEGEHVDVDFTHEVLGSIAIRFGAVAPGTLVEVSFSESGYYVADTTDWPKHYATDRVMPTSGETWTDTFGCQYWDVCADGPHGFRFARIRVTRGSAEVRGVEVRSDVTTPPGWFLSSDDLLNRIWHASVYTAQLNVVRTGPATIDQAMCPIGLEGQAVIVDGAKRDSCPWLGDQAVTDQTLLYAGVHDDAVRTTLGLFAAGQRADGLLPASPAGGWVAELADYPAYWVLALRTLALHRGTDAAQQWWPALRRVLDAWLPAHTDARGLVVDPFGHADYAYVRRNGGASSYLSGVWAEALDAGAFVARALGHAPEADAWAGRSRSTARALAATFWDAGAGAFLDTVAGEPVHPEDGNAFAVLSGAASPAQAAAAFAYLDRTSAHPWGNAIADNDVWDGPDWGYGASSRVYPFMTAFDVLARMQSGLDDGALALLRRTWGWMLDPAHDAPGTMWEAIGPFGSIDGFQKQFTSMAHGWSSGAAGLLSGYVLGVRPTSAGFASFDALPHPGDVQWAQGSVPTPAGAIRLSWRRTGPRWQLRLEAPPGLRARVGAPAPAASRVTVDGRVRRAEAAGGYVFVTLSGAHTVTVGPGF
jgi:hypothetical protein